MSNGDNPTWVVQPAPHAEALCTPSGDNPTWVVQPAPHAEALHIPLGCLPTPSYTQGIDRDCTTGLQLGSYSSSMGDSLVTEDSCFALQLQVPLVAGLAPPGYTGGLHGPTAPAFNPSLYTPQSSHSIQYKPGPFPGIASDAASWHQGE